MEFRSERLKNALRHPITEWQVTKAKRIHRRAFPECRGCDLRPTFWRRNNDVHHIEPVHIAPERATDPTNFVTFCRACHYHIGHLQNWKDWNLQVLRMIYSIRQTWTDLAKTSHGMETRR